jgi:hypothetical protein
VYCFDKKENIPRTCHHSTMSVSFVTTGLWAKYRRSSASHPPLLSRAIILLRCLSYSDCTELPEAFRSSADAGTVVAGGGEGGLGRVFQYRSICKYILLLVGRGTASGNYYIPCSPQFSAPHLANSSHSGFLPPSLLPVPSLLPKRAQCMFVYTRHEEL